MRNAAFDRFHGVYQGKVISNVDPERRGRLLVMVSDATGPCTEIWAEAASPVAGKGMGFYAVPAEGTQVFVSFVGGSVKDAVWLGTPHETLEDLPADVITDTNPFTPPIMLYSEEGHSVSMIDGVQLQGGFGGIFLKHSAGSSIEITDEHIKLTFSIKGGLSSTIELDATGVKINGTALTVSNLGA